MVMILLDYREDRQHPQLKRDLKKSGLEVSVTELSAGDFAFTGRGHGDIPVFVGIELKRLTTSDAIDSLRSGRLADHQIPGMVGAEGIYEYGFLVVEGQYRANTAGQLVVFHRTGWKPAPGGMTVSTLEKHLLTFSFAYPRLTVWQTNRPDDTLAFLVNCFHWFTDKPMDAHTSHLAAHQPQGIIPLSDFRATLQVRCPGMGRAMSKAAEQKFSVINAEGKKVGSLRKAAMAPATDWASIAATDRKGRTKRLGLKKGTEIESWFRHE